MNTAINRDQQISKFANPNAHKRNFHSLTWIDLRGTPMSSDNLLKLLLPENLLAIFIQKNKLLQILNS